MSPSCSRRWPSRWPTGSCTPSPRPTTDPAEAGPGRRPFHGSIRRPGCLGLAGLASGSAGLGMAPSVLAFDIWIMLAVALACLPVFLTGREIARWEGGVFVAYYAAYVAYLILAAGQHAALEAFSATMLGFVVPLTVITLVVATLRRGSP